MKAMLVKTYRIILYANRLLRIIFCFFTFCFCLVND